MKKKAVYAVLMAFFVAVLALPQCSDGAEKKTIEEGKVVNENSKVKVHYTLKVEGNVVDSSRQGDPFEVEMGKRQVIPGFENALMGMKAGETKNVSITPEDGYGEVNPQGIQEIKRDQLPPDIEPAAGMTLYATGADGQVIPVRIDEVKDDTVVINMNHPLAGKTLNFELEVMEVQ